MRPRSPADNLSNREEEKLLKAAGKVFAVSFPNPERVGCPDREVLRAKAFSSAGPGSADDVLDHLTHCSPCFVEYRQFIRDAERSHRWKLLAACATVLIVIGAGIWWSGTIPSLLPPASYNEVVLDLRNQSRVRGGEQPRAPSGTNDIPVLARQRLRISIYLPIGSEEGPYEVQLLTSERDPVVQTQGIAKLEDYNIVIEVEADLRDLDSGQCLLRTRRDELPWSYYSVQLE